MNRRSTIKDRSNARCERGRATRWWNEGITSALAVTRAFFPLDEQLGLDQGSVSPRLVREVVWLSGLVTYGQVSQVLERVGGYQVPTTTVWEHVQHAGEKLVAQQAHQQRQVSLDRTQWEQPRYDSQLRKGVSLEGGMVNIRDEGWKALKVGVVSSLLPPQAQVEDAAKAISHDLHYTAVIGSVEQFAPALWALAVEHLVPYAAHVAVTADGAAWIWNLTADLFPCSTQIVDWYHATQLLAAAANDRFPSAAAAARAWTEQLKDWLSVDEVWKIINALHAASLTQHAPYFEAHRYPMLYAMVRAQGFPIGSGTIESGVKQYKHRLADPGMRWSRPGVERMLVIRSAVLDDSFDRL